MHEAEGSRQESQYSAISYVETEVKAFQLLLMHPTYKVFIQHATCIMVRLTEVESVAASDERLVHSPSQQPHPTSQAGQPERDSTARGRVKEKKKNTY